MLLDLQVLTHAPTAPTGYSDEWFIAGERLKRQRDHDLALALLEDDDVLLILASHA